MNDVYGLTKENMLRVLPDVLRNNENMASIAEAVAEQLEKFVRDVDKLRIYPDIDHLPENLLDILAYDFKVDWWSHDYTIEEKRRTLKDSWMVHRRLGTKAAVLAAVSDIYPESSLEEWFEYGGKPYHFRLSVNITHDAGDYRRYHRVLERLNYYKNLRSHLDNVEYVVKAKEPALIHMGGAVSSVIGFALPEIKMNYNFFGTLHMGMDMAAIHIFHLPQLE